MSDPAYKEEEDHKFSYTDYKGWELKEGERYELIDGVAYAMSAPGILHQRISMVLSGEFYAFLKDKTCQVFAAPFDVRLFFQEDGSDDTVLQPDLVVVCDPEKLGEEGCRGTPDMVAEILSPSNTAIEMERKLNLYREARVREYWVVDPQNKHISAYRLKEDEYSLRTFHTPDNAESSVLPGLEIPLSLVFTP
ncbi:MAG: Uma2 family endonuclease [Treponema sp.]|jgi:Uma2 family endonuclease|nr:Uma2 family endonuclease [Treponema sp.]